MTIVPSPLMASTSAWVTEAPMNSLSGARKVRTLIVSSGALRDVIKLAIEPSDIDVEKLAPVLRRLLALRAPGRLQARVGERGPEGSRRLARLFRYGAGDHGIDAEACE